MRVACQIVCYLVSLLALLFLGGLFDTAFWQTQFHAKHLLGGKPLPIITEFFIAHRHLPPYIVLFPWLAFVGTPLLTSSTAHRYWEPSEFLLRFVAFFTVEAFIFLLFIFAIALPFIPYYGMMEDHHENGVEFAFQLAFWGTVCAVVSAIVFRLIRRHRS